MKEIKVQKNQELAFVLSVEAVQVILAGLDELQHKVAKPIEIMLMEQIQKQQEVQ